MHAPSLLRIFVLHAVLPLFVCGKVPLLWRPSSDAGTKVDAICCVEQEWEGHAFIDWGYLFHDQVY